MDSASHTPGGILLFVQRSQPLRFSRGKAETRSPFQSSGVAASMPLVLSLSWPVNALRIWLQECFAPTRGRR